MSKEIIELARLRMACAVAEKVSVCSSHDIQNAYKIAEAAIRKTIPAKPVKTCDAVCCPECRKILYFIGQRYRENYHYCPSCGQHIDISSDYI
jgi:acetyl-CoA carboxylase beta subunit